MAGIYIHIPFCRTKCHYCDFYKSTDFGAKYDFLMALGKEISSRKGELGYELVESVYFGGGTPSVLQAGEIHDLIELIRSAFILREDAEITLEANPDDLTEGFLHDLSKTGINRLSIGIQSFNDRDLKAMNRRHNAEQAVNCVKNAIQAGFLNISIDLIYGLPGQSLSDWEMNLKQAVSLETDHISAYHLTYHKGTVFYTYLKAGKIAEIPDELSFDQFKLLKHRLEESGYEHYEISNFARNGKYSRHNRSYWERKNYLGFGPSAHSYDRLTRRWNVSGLRKYLLALENNGTYWNNEILSPQDQYNDYMITSLRTKWGISDTCLTDDFAERFGQYFRQEAEPFIAAGQMHLSGGSYTLSDEGLFISDKIMEKLLYVEE
ncbi:MAG: radical SAM family heme chaperone HemW [Prolixibacteraceae bacterium]